MTTRFPGSDETTVVSDGGESFLPAERSLDDRISEILGDQLLPPSQKRVELEELLGKARDVGEEEAYAPVEHQLLHALSLLADGGHDYAVPPVDTDDATDTLI